MKQYNDDNYCFVCGTQNPSGLQLTFRYDETTDEMVSIKNFPRHFQGWEGVLHGGIISSILDEIMIKAAFKKGFKCVTAELNVRFKRPALMENTVTIRGKVTEVRGRVIFAEGRILDPNNTLIASAAGKFMTIRHEENS